MTGRLHYPHYMKLIFSGHVFCALEATETVEEASKKQRPLKQRGGLLKFFVKKPLKTGFTIKLLAELILFFLATLVYG